MTTEPAIIPPATPSLSTVRRGPVPRRRYQEGRFVQENGCFYSFFYRDRQLPDGTTESYKERFKHGKVGVISQLQARKEHGRIRELINRERGTTPAVIKGETFGGVAKAYLEDVAPQLSPSTIRQHLCHLNAHLYPRFQDAALTNLDVRTVQQFATNMLSTHSRKTIINVLGTMFA